VTRLPDAFARTAEEPPVRRRPRELPVLDAALIPGDMVFGSFVELIGDAGSGKSRGRRTVAIRAGTHSVSGALSRMRRRRRIVFGAVGSCSRSGVSGDADANSEALYERMPEASDLVRGCHSLGRDTNVSVLSTQQTGQATAVIPQRHAERVVKLC